MGCHLKIGISKQGNLHFKMYKGDINKLMMSVVGNNDQIFK